jgi:PTS system galactitol-specific IIC component
MGPISEAIKEKIKDQGERQWMIGMTPSLVIGDPQLLVSSVLLIPIIVVCSLVIPHNQFLPIASLAGLIYLLPLILSMTGGSLPRTLFMGTVISLAGNFMISSIAPVFTELAKTTTIQIPEGRLVASLDYGSSPVVYILYLIKDHQLFFAFVLAGIISAFLLLNFVRIKRLSLVRRK